MDDYIIEEMKNCLPQLWVSFIINFCFFLSAYCKIQKNKKTIIEHTKNKSLIWVFVGVTICAAVFSGLSYTPPASVLKESLTDTPSPVLTATTAAALPTAILFAAGESMTYGRYP